MSAMPTPTAIRIIREEHQALSAMLSSLHLLLRQHRQDGTPVRFDVLRAMLFYIDEFPERLHHRKETDLLFPLIRARSDSAGEILEKLDRDHGVGERAIRDLEHTLLSWEMLGDSRRDGFEQAVERYLSFYLKHMQLEEEVVLPLARKSSTRAWSKRKSGAQMSPETTQKASRPSAQSQSCTVAMPPAVSSAPP